MIEFKRYARIHDRYADYARRACSCGDKDILRYTDWLQRTLLQAEDALETARVDCDAWEATAQAYYKQLTNPPWISTNELLPSENHADEDKLLWVYDLKYRQVCLEHYEDTELYDYWMPKAKMPRPPV